MEKDYQFDYERAVEHKSEFMKTLFDRMSPEVQMQQDQEFRELCKIPGVEKIMLRFEQSKNEKEALEYYDLIMRLIRSIVLNE